MKNRCTEQSCPGVQPAYDPDKSLSYHSYNGAYKKSYYETGYVGGTYSYDKFCFNAFQSDSCFDEYLLNFIGADHSTKGLQDFQGIIGLGPKLQNGVNIFLSEVKRNNLDNTFSVYFTLNTQDQSKIIFGPP